MTAFDRYRAKAEARRGRETSARTETRPGSSQKATPPPSLPTRGRGWKILEHPRASHESLERHVQGLWDFVWHGLPWPEGWTVRWGAMNAKELMSLSDWIREELGRARADGRAQCAISVNSKILGLCVPSQRLILLDEANHRELRRTPRQFAEVCLHELIHSQIGFDDGDHGPKFQAALASATSYFFGPADESAPAARL